MLHRADFSRREILWGLSGLAGMGGLPAISRADGYAPKLAVQVYVWTQQLRKEKRTLAEGLSDVIAGCRAAGYERAELMNSFFTPEIREQTISLLKQHGLQIPIVYSGGVMHTEPEARKSIASILEFADVVAPIGTRIIDVNPTPKPEKAAKTGRELAVQARAINKLDEQLKEKGFDLILHHHDPEMQDEAREWRHILANTTAGLCLDTHWILRGGQNVMEIVKEAGDRVVSYHLRNSKNNIWSEALEDGDIDYSELASYLKQTGYNGYLLVELAYQPETKITRTLEENLRLSRQYAEEVFDL